MKINLQDTIVALSTPPGHGAIGIVRLSGPEAIEKVDEAFYGKNLLKVEGNTVHYGKIKDEEGRILDEGLATVFRSPKSYTKEDIVELSCHGSPYIMKEVLQLFLRKGVRMAEPGEFTLRSFLNGQMDLTQAEAVADLIASDSEMSHTLAIQQMRGGFSKDIKKLRDELIEFASLIELELDFGEEDVEFADRKRLKSLVIKIQRAVGSLLDSFQLGNAIKNGVPTVISGRPNAGKSTLLNALLNEERAIVSEIPGTTRDTIEESLNIGGIQFRLIDTAGIRRTQDTIEKLGVERTMEQISLSSIVLYLFDITTTPPEKLWKNLSIFKEQSKPLTGKSKFIFVANKMDLNPYTCPEDYYKDGLVTQDNLITASAKNKMNIEYLKEKIKDLVLAGNASLDKTVVTNIRHYEALKNAQKSLDTIKEGIESGLSGDLVALDIRQCLRHLGEISGEISTDDLLESIFSTFCIGK